MNDLAVVVETPKFSMAEWNNRSTIASCSDSISLTIAIFFLLLGKAGGWAWEALLHSILV
jgi:hypothetical protein